MEAKERCNCLRIFILVVDFIKVGFSNLIELHIKNKSISFEDFINRHQHDIYHNCFAPPCCQCVSKCIGSTKRVINSKQLEVLFDKQNKKIPPHKQGHSTGPKADFCCSKPKPSLSENDLDITLARFILLTYCTEVFWYPFKSFEDFLNNSKHDIYHMCFGNSQCCLCSASYQYPPLISSVSQEWATLFSSTCSPCTNCQLCCGSKSVCAIAATFGITEKKLKDTTFQSILENCSPIWNAVCILADIRNNMYGHITKVRISDADFQINWSKARTELLKIADICEKVQETRQKLDDLKQRTLDEKLLAQYQVTLQEELLRNDELKKKVGDTLETITDNVKEIKEDIGKRLESVEVGLKEVNENVTDGRKALSNEVKEVKEKTDFLAKALFTENDRERCERYKDITDEALKVHILEDIYVSTEGLKIAERFLHGTGLVVLTGPPGAGKSRMGLQLQWQYCEAHSDYYAIKLDQITDWVKIVNVYDRVIVFLDDIFGTSSCIFDENVHKKILDDINVCIKASTVKVIISMRTSIQIAFKRIFDRHVLFNTCTMVDLGKECGMNKQERIECLRKHCDKRGIQVVNERNSSLNYLGRGMITVQILDDIASVQPCQLLGYPEACFLFTSQFLHKGLKFFTKANSVLCENIVEMYEKCKVHYSILIFALLNGGKVNKSVNSGDVVSITTVYESIYSSGELLTIWDIKNALASMEGSYLICQESSVLTFQHRAILEAVLISYKESNQEKVMQLMDLDFIVEFAIPADHETSTDIIRMTIYRDSYKLLAKQIVSAIFKASDRFECVAKLMGSPIITLSGIEMIQHLMQESDKMPVLNCLTLYGLKKGVCNFLLSSFFELNVAMFFFCKGNQQILLHLKGKIDHKLRTTNDTNLRNIIVDVFFCLCLQSDTDKLAMISNIIRQNKIYIGDLDNLNTSVMLMELLKDTSYLVKMCDFLDESQTENVNFVMNEACDDGQLEAVDVLLKTYGTDMFSADDLLTSACSSENVDIVKLLLDTFGHAVFNAEKALNEACSKTDNTILVTLLLNTFNRDFLDLKSAFNNACRQGHVQVVHLLIDKFNALDFDFKTAMNEACLSGDNDVFKLMKFGLHSFQDLFDKNLQRLNRTVNYRTVNYGTVISRTLKDSMMCIWKKVLAKEFFETHEEYVRLASHSLSFTISFYKTYNDFNVSISSAKQYADELHLRFSQMLRMIERGKGRHILLLFKEFSWDIWTETATPSPYPLQKEDFVDALENCPVQMISLCQDVSIVKLLLEKFDHKLCDVKTAMNLACRTQNFELVQLLLREFPKTLFDVNSAMVEALQLFGRKVVLLLIDTFDQALFDSNMLEAQFNRICKAGEKELMLIFLNTFNTDKFDINSAFDNACWSPNTGILEKLLDFIIDHNLCYSSELQESCLISSTDDIRKMAKISKPNRLDIKEALNLACQSGDKKVVQIILNKFNHNLFDKSKLMYLARTADIVQLLLDTFGKNEFDVNTLFCSACRSGSLPLVKCVLDGIDHNLIDIKNAMNKGCRSGNLDVVKFLLEKFDRSLMDVKDAIIFACYSDKVQLVKYLVDTFGKRYFDARLILNQACRSGNHQIVKFVLDTFHYSPLDRKTAILYACYSGKVSMVRFMLDTFKNISFDSKLLLNSACYSCNPNVVRFVLTTFKYSPIEVKFVIVHACFSGKVEMVRLFIDTFGRDLFNAKMIINEACKRCNVAVLEYVLEVFGQDNADKKGAFNNACRSGEINKVKFVLDSFGRNVVDEESAIEEACRSGNIDVVQFVLKEFGKQLVDKTSSINEACRSGNLDVVKHVLEEFGQNHIDQKGALNEACKSGNVDVVKFVLDNCDQSTLLTNSPLNETCRSQNEELVKFVLKNFGHSFVDEKSVIYKACRFGNLDVVKFAFNFIGQNVLDKNCIIIGAFRSGNMDIVTFVLEYFGTCHVDKKDAVNGACRSGNFEVIQFVFDTFGKSFVDEKSAIHATCKSGNVSAVRYVLNYFERDCFDEKSQMNEACRSGNIDLVKFALRKIDPDCVDKTTAINKACRSGDLETVKHLIDTFGQGQVDDKSAMDAACASGNVEMVRFVLGKVDFNQVDWMSAIMQSCQLDDTNVVEFLLDTLDHNLFDVKVVLSYAFGHDKLKLAKVLERHMDHNSSDVKSAIIKECANLSVNIVDFIFNNYDEYLLGFDLIMNQACGDCNIPLIKFFMREVDCSFLDVKEASITACEKGHIQVVKMLLDKYGPSLLDLQSLSQTAERNGDIDMATYISEISKNLVRL